MGTRIVGEHFTCSRRSVWEHMKGSPALALALLLTACPKETVQPEPPVNVVEQAYEAWLPAAPPSDDVIYFVMVDRFANGDPSNDGAIDPSDPTAFHGGDLQGVIDRLDHLQRLGVRTVWLSPVFQMRTDKFFEWGAFHGYWVQDPTRVEPRFGDEALLRRLSDELHARDMRLLLDVVWNHVSFDAPLRSERPDWFHTHGGIEDWHDPFELVNHEVHGLPDYAQENPEVRDYLLEASLKWVRAAQPDGFRVDAVRHMPHDFLADMSRSLRARAGQGFFLLGEDFQGDPVALAETWEAGGFDSMFDFPMHYAMLDVFCEDRHPGRLAAMLSGDGAYPDPQRLVTFLDNHDLPRVMSRCHGDLGRVRRALAFQLTTRGIPAITWGLEAGFEGEGEPENRASMVFGAGHLLEEDIQTLLAFRRRHPALLEGVTQRVHTIERHMGYHRVADGEYAMISFAGGGMKGELELPAVEGELLVVDDELQLYELSPELEGRSIPAAEGQLVVMVMEAGDGGYAMPSDEPVTLRIEVPDLPLDPGDELVLTGSGRALGNWNPAEPAGVFQREGDVLVLDVEQPAHTVLEVKLVIRRADGAVEWQDGENRYLYASEGEPEPATLYWTE
jgi:glycosidase